MNTQLAEVYRLATLVGKRFKVPVTYQDGGTAEEPMVLIEHSIGIEACMVTIRKPKDLLHKRARKVKVPGFLVTTWHDVPAQIHRGEVICGPDVDIEELGSHQYAYQAVQCAFQAWAGMVVEDELTVDGERQLDEELRQAEELADKMKATDYPLPEGLEDDEED